MVIKGKFIGETSYGFLNGSNGFITGRIYEISITSSCDGAGNYIAVRDLHGDGYCWYTNIQTLADNWEIPANDGEWQVELVK